MKKLLVWSLVVPFFACTGNDDAINSSLGSYNIEHPAYFGTNYNTPEDNPITNEGFKLGRFLFYDTILSKDKTISCASCHKQEFAFSDNQQLSLGVNNLKTRRHSMTIVNAMWQNTFFWDGRANSLEEQALRPIEAQNEMNLPIDSALVRLNNSSFYQEKFTNAFGSSEITAELLAKAISQFERALISGNSKFDLYKQGRYQLSEAEARGEQLFFTHPEPSQNLRGGNCGDCHSGFMTTDNSIRNNGLPQVGQIDLGLEEVTNNRFDKRKFKTVTLRNIAVSAPYMHDGRFTTLEEVLEHYNDHIQGNENIDPLIVEGSNYEDKSSLGLTDQEKSDIISFLHLLTDEDFLSNNKFSNPFK